MEYQLGTSIVNNSKGKITCNRAILLSIINLAAKEIEGVSKLCDNFGTPFKKWFSNNYYEGVKVNYDNDGLSVDIYMNVKYGYTVSDVSYKVQENVKNGILSMMDVAVNNINIHILGVDFQE